MTEPGPNPFVVGQWVRGERFYGRQVLIEDILGGPRNSLWVLGTRRIGKTSLLKQLELVASTDGSTYLPVFWDFQGADEPHELYLSFSDALLDAADQLQALGLDASALSNGDLFASMGTLRRELRSRGRTLLLLCDEVEELLNLHRKDPALLRKLRRAMHSQEGVRSVLTSSVRLCELAEQRDDTSPFLHGFSPPLYISGLSDTEALALVHQEQGSAARRPDIDDGLAHEICRRCSNHPYLVQLVCKRFLDTNDLGEACRQVASDRMINYFFSVDFEMLSPTEQAVLELIAERGAATEASLHAAISADIADRDDALQRLENLGLIGRADQRSYVLPGCFFRRWLEDLAVQKRPPRDGSLHEDTTISVRVIDGRYALHEQIGSGATGSVYKARDAVLDTWVALKLLNSEYTSNRDALERVRQEILLSRDIAHPNILRVYHLASSEAGTYITMQWIKGKTLADLIAERGALPVREVVSLAIKLASALVAAHSHNVLHRDIKPGNILIDEGGEPYLADFGLARLIGERGLTQHGVFIGTPHYCSPEQVALQELDQRSDIYSLGLVIFEMATGRRTFEAGSVGEVLAMQRSAQPPDPRAVSPMVPGELAAVILRCLAKDPAERVISALDLHETLLRIAENL